MGGQMGGTKRVRGRDGGGGWGGSAGGEQGILGDAGS